MAKVTFKSALANLASTLTTTKKTEDQTKATIDLKRAEAVNAAIDAGLASKATNAEIKEAIKETLEETGNQIGLSPNTVKAYVAGLVFALDNGVPWSTDLHGIDGQVKACLACKRELPKALKAKVEKAEAKRKTKTSATSAANKASIVKHLAKALADARTIGSQHAGDILDVIHCFDPEFKEPEAAPI